MYPKLAYRNPTKGDFDRRADGYLRVQRSPGGKGHNTLPIFISTPSPSNMPPTTIAGALTSELNLPTPSVPSESRFSFGPGTQPFPSLHTRKPVYTAPAPNPPNLISIAQQLGNELDLPAHSVRSAPRFPIRHDTQPFPSLPPILHPRQPVNTAARKDAGFVPRGRKSISQPGENTRQISRSRSLDLGTRPTLVSRRHSFQVPDHARTESKTRASSLPAERQHLKASSRAGTIGKRRFLARLIKWREWGA